jgi:hypothetical protein
MSTVKTAGCLVHFIATPFVHSGHSSRRPFEAALTVAEGRPHGRG